MVIIVRLMETRRLHGEREREIYYKSGSELEIGTESDSRLQNLHA